MKHAMRLAGIALVAACSSYAVPAAAEDGDGSGARRVMIGTGVQSIPAFPGAGDNRVTFLPLVDTWREGEPMTVESPDEAFGFAVIGSAKGPFAVGPALTFAPTRAADDLPGLSKVGFGLEAGAFVDFWPVRQVRLRGELRQGIGAHKALTGDLAADVVWREGKEGPVLTVGPRLRWGSAKYNRAYFGVPAGTGAPFPAYQPGGGIYAYGAAAGLRLPLGRTLGLYGYAGYDRLSGEAASSPIVASGSRDQYSAGLALTYRFTL